MSARKISSAGLGSENVTIQGRQACLDLTADSVLIRRNGIEFRSPTSFQPWTEMTLTLNAGDNDVIKCTGVVVDCTGTRHSGYRVAMVFTSLSRQASERLAMLADSSLA